jgi:hypothetical protein
VRNDWICFGFVLMIFFSFVFGFGSLDVYMFSCFVLLLTGASKRNYPRYEKTKTIMSSCCKFF